LLVFEDDFTSKLCLACNFLISCSFLYLNSITEIREKILHFFDNVILKMKSSPNDIIPLESCQCKELLQIVILPLAQHFVALEENNKALYYFLELASAYLILGDNYNVSCYSMPPPPPPSPPPPLRLRHTARPSSCVLSHYFLLVSPSIPFLRQSHH
jgi:hypothetical protein